LEKEYSHLHSIEIITIFEETKTIEMTGNEPKIDIDKIVKHWIETSDSDFQTMLDLYKSKSYGWSLFLGHISTEKLLKALYLKKLNDHPPRTHNLYRLCELIQIDLSDEYADWLDEITSFLFYHSAIILTHCFAFQTNLPMNYPLFIVSDLYLYHKNKHILLRKSCFLSLPLDS